MEKLRYVVFLKTFQPIIHFLNQSLINEIESLLFSGKLSKWDVGECVRSVFLTV